MTENPFGSVTVAVIDDAESAAVGVQLTVPVVVPVQPVGSPLVLELPSPAGVLNVHARVAWVGASGMGVRFTRALGG